MIFKQWQQVLDGTKTQTRQLVQPGDFCPLMIEDNCIGVERNGRLLWQIGNTYAIQPGRSKKAVGRICITGIRRKQLQDISFNDMLCEGYPIALFGYAGNFDKNPTVRDWFISLWDSINAKEGTRWADSPDVWVLTFECLTSQDAL